MRGRTAIMSAAATLLALARAGLDGDVLVVLERDGTELGRMTAG